MGRKMLFVPNLLGHTSKSMNWKKHEGEKARERK